MVNRSRRRFVKRVAATVATVDMLVATLDAALAKKTPTALSISEQFGITPQPLGNMETFAFKPKSIPVSFAVSPVWFDPTPEHPMKALMMKKHLADTGLGEPLTSEEQALYDAWYARIEAEADENEDEQ